MIFVLKILILKLLFISYRFVGEGRSQFCHVQEEDPGEVKELAEKLEKLQTPDPDDAGYVKLQLAL